MPSDFGLVQVRFAPSKGRLSSNRLIHCHSCSREIKPWPGQPIGFPLALIAQSNLSGGRKVLLLFGGSIGWREVCNSRRAAMPSNRSFWATRRMLPWWCVSEGRVFESGRGQYFYFSAISNSLPGTANTAPTLNQVCDRTAFFAPVFRSLYRKKLGSYHGAELRHSERTNGRYGRSNRLIQHIARTYTEKAASSIQQDQPRKCFKCPKSGLHHQFMVSASGQCNRLS